MSGLRLHYTVTTYCVQGEVVFSKPILRQLVVLVDTVQKAHYTSIGLKIQSEDAPFAMANDGITYILRRCLETTIPSLTCNTYCRSLHLPPSAFDGIYSPSLNCPVASECINCLAYNKTSLRRDPVLEINVLPRPQLVDSIVCPAYAQAGLRSSCTFAIVILYTGMLNTIPDYLCHASYLGHTDNKPPMLRPSTTPIN